MPRKPWTKWLPQYQTALHHLQTLCEIAAQVNEAYYEFAYVQPDTNGQFGWDLPGPKERYFLAMAVRESFAPNVFDVYLTVTQPSPTGRRSNILICSAQDARGTGPWRVGVNEPRSTSNVRPWTELAQKHNIPSLGETTLYDEMTQLTNEKMHKLVKDIFHLHLNLVR